MEWHEKLQNEGTWQNLKGKLREEWAELTDDELEEARANWDQFVGTVKEKTGAAAETVETKVKALVS